MQLPGGMREILIWVEPAGDFFMVMDFFFLCSACGVPANSEHEFLCNNTITSFCHLPNAIPILLHTPSHNAIICTTHGRHSLVRPNPSRRRNNQTLHSSRAS
mmetsp:Transcript_7547/g.28363  ORF Transcript_7547/g.28363 Transcript_7547/m.28363 type:complete len:102 (+) Transcript_7547:2561-2866(+)